MLLEALAALTAVQRWARLFEHDTGYIMLDNQPLELAWKKGRSKSPRVNDVLREALLVLLEHDAQIFPLRVQSSDNTVADALSRVFEPSSTGWAEVQSWKLERQVCQLPVCPVPRSPSHL